MCLGIRGISGTSIRAHSLSLRLHVQCHAFWHLVSMLGFRTGLWDSIVPGKHRGGNLKWMYERLYKLSCTGSYIYIYISVNIVFAYIISMLLSCWELMRRNKPSPTHFLWDSVWLWISVFTSKISENYVTALNQ